VRKFGGGVLLWESLSLLMLLCVRRFKNRTMACIGSIMARLRLVPCLAMLSQATAAALNKAGGDAPQQPLVNNWATSLTHSLTRTPPPSTPVGCSDTAITRLFETANALLICILLSTGNVPHLFKETHLLSHPLTHPTHPPEPQFV
jgi:hypothetical protein